MSAGLDTKIQEQTNTADTLTNQIQQQEATATENKKHIAAQEKKIKSLKGKVLSVEQIERIPVKISKPMLGGDESATVPKRDWDNVKKTALTQAQTTEEYQATLSENDTLKKQRAKLRKDKQGLEDKVVELEKSTKEKFLERATRESELYNLKNDVAMIPQEVWDMYTKPKMQQRNLQNKKYQQEGR